MIAGIPLAIAIALVVIAILVLRFIIKTALTIAKIAAVIFAGVGFYFLFNYVWAG